MGELSNNNQFLWYYLFEFITQVLGKKLFYWIFYIIIKLLQLRFTFSWFFIGGNLDCPWFFCSCCCYFYFETGTWKVVYGFIQLHYYHKMTLLLFICSTYLELSRSANKFAENNRSINISYSNETLLCNNTWGS